MATQFVTISGFMTTADVDAHPEHPIVIPPPENIPTHPIVIPPLPPLESGGVPTHPIYLPPHIWGPTDPRPTPPINLPQPPLGTWGGANVPMPSPPIYIPGPPPAEEPPRTEYTWAWSPYYSSWIILPPDTAAQPKAGKK